MPSPIRHYFCTLQSITCAWIWIWHSMLLCRLYLFLLFYFFTYLAHSYIVSNEGILLYWLHEDFHTIQLFPSQNKFTQCLSQLIHLLNEVLLLLQPLHA